MRRLLGLGVLGLIGCAGETPGSGGGVLPDGNHVPTVHAFKCSPQAGVQPLETTCAWEISEKDPEAVRCAIDVGAEGTPEKVIENCPAVGAERFKVTQTGTVAIRLHLADARGATAFLDSVVSVTPAPNASPRVDRFTADPPLGGAPLTVTFGFGVSDPDGDALTCRVLEGDQVLVAPSACGATEVRTAVVSAVGVHRVTLEVLDDKGARATKEASFEVTALPQVGDLRISKIEWGQTMLNPNLRLVEGKDALLRVFVVSERAGVGGVTVTATGTRSGTGLGELTLTGPGTAPTADDANSLGQQWRVVVPAAWIAPGLSVRVRVDPANRLGETDEGNNEQTLNPVVGAGNVLAVTHVPIVQSGRTGTVRNIEQAMKQVWPMKGVAAQTRAAYTYGGTVTATGQGWGSLLDQLRQVRQNDGSRRNYLGWISISGLGGVAGLAYVGIGVALSRDDTIATAVHELGHNMGREHAPCGGAGGSDPSYPVANARLDAQGWDFTNGRLILPNQAYDVMSYCDPQWVSLYNYRAVQQWLETHPVPATAAFISSPYIMVNGRVAEGQVFLSPLSLIEAPADAEIAPGDYRLTLHGERTVSVPFGTAHVADGDEEHFALLVPPVEGLYAVEISRSGRVLARRFAGPPRPRQQAEVTSVPGGVELTWNAAAFAYASVSHLERGGGHTTLALWLEGGRAFVSTLGLADGGELEISLSDGVQSQRVLIAR